MQERQTWADVWRKLGDDSKAGFILIDHYDDSKGGAEAYLAKYTTKGGQIDISKFLSVDPICPKSPYVRDYKTTEVTA